MVFEINLKHGGTFGSVKIDGQDIEGVRGLEIETRYDKQTTVIMEIIPDELRVSLDDPLVKANVVCPTCGMGIK